RTNASGRRLEPCRRSAGTRLFAPGSSGSRSSGIASNTACGNLCLTNSGAVFPLTWQSEASRPDTSESEYLQANYRLDPIRAKTFRSLLSAKLDCRIDRAGLRVLRQRRFRSSSHWDRTRSRIDRAEGWEGDFPAAASLHREATCSRRLPGEERNGSCYPESH